MAVCKKCGYMMDELDEECLRCREEEAEPDESADVPLPPSRRASRLNPLATGFIVLLCLLCLWLGLRAPDYGPGPAAPRAPLQGPVQSDRSFSHKIFTITPLATFDIEALVLSKMNYYMGRETQLSKTDLALGWGRMSDREILSKIKITQGGRMYIWWTRELPIPEGEISSSSANMHIIPANGKAARALARVRRGRLVHIKGYLIRAQTSDGWHWNSSLTRNDTGNGACEVIWAEEVEIVKPSRDRSGP